MSLQEIATKFDQMGRTNSRAYPKTKALAAIQGGTIVGPITEVHVVKFFDEYGLKVAIPSSCKPRDITCVVISEDTKRFVNEIHNHHSEVRSSEELLDNLQ